MGDMIYQKLVDLIQDNADQLTKRLMRDILSREETKSYKTLPEKEVYWRVFDVYSRLDSWLSKDKEKGEIKLHYTELGKKRFHENIPLSDLVMTLLLIKRHLWIYVMENQFYDSSFELSRALELNNKVVLFFDRAIYFAVMGYEDEMRKSLNKAV
ncbi:MAG TPA: hypothetical protein P5146_14405 [Desulfomonilia bacterium]|nr:hypothetical protein [Deltaproteobacteria bacterium]HPL87474.1 hypothetical protein [Deltaproteobacteria bacterium]HRR70481.1 hypothetical protein [Desulfomonilia bacterium]